MTSSRRADLLLVERGFFESRARAQEAIAAGLVKADGDVVRKPSQGLPDTARIEAAAPHPYVSRGGVKLAAALDAFSVDPAGLAVLDVGASTGGFTDVLLRRGALRVHAVDSGHGQLHPALANDPRVVMLEGTDARRLDGGLVPQAPDLVVADVSFISLTLALPAALALARPGARLVALIKPQFEVGRAHVGKGGIVRDPSARDAACRRVTDWLAASGWAIEGLIPSPITGGDGNVEFLVCAMKGNA